MYALNSFDSILSNLSVKLFHSACKVGAETVRGLFISAAKQKTVGNLLIQRLILLSLEALHLALRGSQRSKQPLESKSKPLNLELIECDEGNEYS